MTQLLPDSAPSSAARLLAWLNGFYRRPDKPLYFETVRYHQWLRDNAELLYNQVYSRHTSFRDKAVLDLACGQGGKLSAYSERGARLLCGLDINPEVLGEAAALLPPAPRSPVVFVVGDAHALPFNDATFDVVISDDGFDHFENPQVVLNEMGRVLKPEGLAFVSFVPYCSPNCSHMNEYLRVPWHHVFWTRRALWQALCLVSEREARMSAPDAHTQRTPVAGVFNTFQHHLSRLTFRGFCRALAKTEGLQLVRMRKQSKDWARPFTYTPFVRELFTDAVYCVLRKKTGARIRRRAFAGQLLLDVAQDTRALAQRCFRALVRLAGIHRYINRSRDQAGSGIDPGFRNHDVNQVG